MVYPRGVERDSRKKQAGSFLVPVEMLQELDGAICSLAR